MKPTLLTLVWMCSVAIGWVANADDDWPVWRGPTLNAIAPSGQNPPTQWDSTTNVKWKTRVPGRGHSSPIIVGQKIFLTTAIDASKEQAVLCFDRKTGEQLWQTSVNQGNFEGRIHGNNTHASPTIVANNGLLFAVFNNNQSVQLACLNQDGKIIWQKNTGEFKPRFPFGYGSSPCLYRDMVIVLSDCPSGFLAAYRQADGTEVWRTKRGQGSSYSSPIVATVNGEDQLILSGPQSVYSYDPANGKTKWNVRGPWQVTCGTAVWDDSMVYVSGGFPTAGTLGIKADGSQVVWQKPVKSYEQSMLIHNGYLYAVSDRGVAYCWEAKTGTEMWKERLWNGPVSSSPVLANGNIYFTNERGKTFIVKANPQKFEVVAENQLGDGCFATMTILNNEIFTRVFNRSEGKANQWLYCLTDQ